MRRERVSGPAARWQEWRWTLDCVVADEASFGREPRQLPYSADAQRWLHPGFQVHLQIDDAEGHYLNATAEAPCFWVMWRMEAVPGMGDEPVALPQVVTLSYYHAGRLLDAQETVEQVPAPPDVVAFLQAFVGEHYQPEVKRRQRPASFQSLQDRFGNPASISTGKKYGGGPPQ
ncbi:MAG: DUF3305 domain-containing protein [Burkholderiaceae bacterium]